MITAPGGYPTRSWGAGGYGLECADRVAACVAACRRRDGRRRERREDPARPRAGARRRRARRRHRAGAFERGAIVAVHALTDAAAARAAGAGADVLAHTPTETLSDATVAAWSGGAVISTLVAFGGSDTTVDNLRRLRAAGCSRPLRHRSGQHAHRPPSTQRELALLGRGRPRRRGDRGGRHARSGGGLRLRRPRRARAGPRRELPPASTEIPRAGVAALASPSLVVIDGVDALSSRAERVAAAPRATPRGARRSHARPSRGPGRRGGTR